MRKVILFMVVSLFSREGFCQNPRWRIPDEPRIPARTDLDVRWNSSWTNIPPKVSIFRLVPHRFSTSAISNIETLCDFSGGTGIKEGDGLYFHDAAQDRTLFISLTVGDLRYKTSTPRYGPTNLAKGVPAMNDLPMIAAHVLDDIQIPKSSVTGYFEGEKFNFSEPLTMYYVGDQTITNIAFRSIKFRRCVDGIPVAGGETGSFDVGESGRIMRADLDWHDLASCESRSTLSYEQIIALLRKGKCFQWMLPENVNPFDWRTVKSVTVDKVRPCYFSGNSDLLFPFLVLFTIVDTGQDKVELQIESPIIDETKPVKRGAP